ncbi:MAG: M18 family aminopeptidase [Massiliimalia sp.]
MKYIPSRQTEDITKELCELLTAGVSPVHTIEYAKRFLNSCGFQELPLDAAWDSFGAGKYYVDGYGSTLAAFTVGENPLSSLRMAASHTDWPCLKVKPSPEISAGGYGKLNVEVYGGPILSTWLDRPLSLAGRVCLRSDDPFHPIVCTLALKQPLLTIPNVAIHLNPTVNQGVALNAQTDLQPILTVCKQELEQGDYFLNLLAKETGAKKEDILDYEFCVYNWDEPTLLGMHQEMLSAPRLDNLTSVHACLSAICFGDHPDGIRMSVLYDNEEVGSATKQGADSALTSRILEKIYATLGYSHCDYLDALSRGFLLSMDVAQAFHPNHPEKYDPKNQLPLGCGVGIKLASSQAYATDPLSTSVIEAICQKGDIPYRKFSNRSDIRGGSTLGSISSALLAIRTVDIGIPLLAMHSSRELMAVSDQTAMVKLAQDFLA